VSPAELPSAKPGGLPRAFSAWHSLRKPGKSPGIAEYPASFIMLSRYTMQYAITAIGREIHRSSRTL
jgi:hypothetical protein